MESIQTSQESLSTAAATAAMVNRTSGGTPLATHPERAGPVDAAFQFGGFCGTASAMFSATVLMPSPCLILRSLNGEGCERVDQHAQQGRVEDGLECVGLRFFEFAGVAEPGCRCVSLQTDEIDRLTRRASSGDIYSRSASGWPRFG
jgi:hypothetical protein